MINKPTVFVLGAGASAVFGFPIGQRLTESLIDLLHSNNQIYDQFIQASSFSAHQINHFRAELERSALNSVDLFLERRPEFMDIGKAAMALMLIERENSSTLWDVRDENWMKYLFNRVLMTKTFEEFTQNKVSFVTFNYDRSLEYFLSSALQGAFGKSESEVAGVFDCVRIIHLHGRLGFLPWQHASQSRPYNAEIDPGILEICMRQIKVVHEDISDGRDKEFEESKVLLSKAQRICFLGFGFGAVNIERLNLTELTDNIAWSTAKGLTAAECSQIRTACMNKVHFREGSDCISFLRNQPTWD